MQNLPDLDSLDINNLDGKATNSPWQITAEEFQSYEKIFKHFDKNNSNSVTENEMQKVIKQTNLPSEVCAKVWELVNPNYEDTFTKPQFCMCMQLLVKSKSGTPLPD